MTEPFLSRFIVEVAPRASTGSTCLRPGAPATLLTSAPTFARGRQLVQPKQCFHTSPPTQRPKEREQRYNTQTAPDSSYSQPAANLSQDVTRAEQDEFHARLQAAHKQLQTRTPWAREGSDVPPVARLRSAGAMTKGKLLTTPSRMLKLILPLTTRDWNRDRKDVEPLALLVHPQQPLSYLERLVQSELPMVRDRESDKERAPKVVFRAEDSMEESLTDRKAEEREEKAEEEKEQKQKKKQQKQQKQQDDEQEQEEKYDIDNPEEQMVDGKLERTGKIGGGRKDNGAAKDKEVMKADGFPEDKEHPAFVRWSPSTEIGDFIRDAARGKEFAVDIEGAPEPIYVGVPSFADRTFYLRMRLRKTARRIADLANIKKECDDLAQQGAKRLAQGGFIGLLGWWGAVYYLTFKTDLGWDVMEPVTYLVGLSGLIGGYTWFLYHNREVSYRSAMNFTVSRRQSQLYELKGFNLPRWEMLVEEGNRLRREIKLVAEEYDVDWDETRDEGSEEVREALRKERRKKDDEDEDKKEDKKDKDDD